mgnify:CR=1 FL=1
MKSFCKYFGVVVGVFLYFWFMWNIFPNWTTPFGKMEVVDGETGGVKFLMVLFPFLVAVGTGIVGRAVGYGLYSVYKFLNFLAHCWVKKVDGVSTNKHC